MFWDFILIRILSDLIFIITPHIKIVNPAIKLKLNGAYISAHNRNYRFNNYKLKKNFRIIGSAHNLIELNIKKQQNIKEIFISPIFKHKNNKYVNRGIIKNLKVSQFTNFLSRSSDYLPFLKDAKYIGSMFVVRAIMKNKEKTDERTSIIKIHSKKIISILSGKWNNSVYLAKSLKIWIFNESLWLKVSYLLRLILKKTIIKLHLYLNF